MRRSNRFLNWPKRTPRRPPVPAATTADAATGPTAAVAMVDDRFVPNALTIAAGTTVVWTNKGSDWHDVNAEDGSFSSGADGTLGPGDTFTYTFTQAGSFGYLCNVHPWMRGKVVVQ